MQWTRNPTSRSNVISLLTIIWKPHALFTITLGSKNVTRYHFYSHNYYYPKVSYSSRALDKVPPTHVPFFCLQKFYKDRNDLINKNFLFIKVFSREKRKKEKTNLSRPLREAYTEIQSHENTFKSSYYQHLRHTMYKADFPIWAKNKAPIWSSKGEEAPFHLLRQQFQGSRFPFFSREPTMLLLIEVKTEWRKEKRRKQAWSNDLLPIIIHAIWSDFPALLTNTQCT